jgi:hypothetical protein
MAKKNILSTEL